LHVPDAATWTAVTAPITTLLGTLGGYWFAGRNDDKRDERAARRERDARRDARTERLGDQRHEIQRQTLFALQDELEKLSSSHTVTATAMYLRLHGKEQVDWGSEKSSAIAYSETLSAVQRLHSRILDPRLRESVARFIAKCNPYAIRYTDRSADEVRAEVQAQIMEVGFQYLDVMEQLGAELRRELDRLAQGQLERGDHRNG
jgi:hypothetical protein